MQQGATATNYCNPAGVFSGFELLRLNPTATRSTKRQTPANSTPGHTALHPQTYYVPAVPHTSLQSTKWALCCQPQGHSSKGLTEATEPSGLKTQLWFIAGELQRTRNTAVHSQPHLEVAVRLKRNPPASVGRRTCDQNGYWGPAPRWDSILCSSNTGAETRDGGGGVKGCSALAEGGREVCE